MGLAERWDVSVTVPTVFAGLLTGLLLRRKKTGRSWIWWLLPICVLGGFVRAQNVRRACDRECLLALDGKEAVVEGTVCTLQKRQDGWAFGLEDCILYPAEGRTDSGNLMGLLVYTETADRPLLGSRVRAEGTMKAIDMARNPGEFDYRLYYRAKKQNYRMFADGWEAVGCERNFDRYRELLYGLSVKAGEILDRTAHGRDAGIYRAVLLGDKAELNGEVRSLYQSSGISHLLAISGLHLSMCSAAVYGAARKLGLGYGKAGAAGGLILCSYAVMTGASPSVVRALVMVLFGYGAACFGRTYDLLTALGAAAAVICWDSPYQLTQAGVQLSFGALLGIGAAGPCLSGWLRQYRGGMAGNVKEEKAADHSRSRAPWKDMVFPVGETLMVSLGLQLTTIPVILYHFFQLPLYGILVNLAAVPLMGIVVASGTAGILLGSVSAAAGRFAMGSGHGVLCLYEVLCRICSRLPGNTLVLGRPGWRQLVIYYVCLMYVLFSLRRSKRTAGRFLRLRCSGALLAMALVLRAPSAAGFQAVFLDVGQGDGIVLRTGGKVILIDGGSTDEKALGQYRLEPYLKSIGETEIDLAVVTHGDADHISGLEYLLEESEKITVKCLALPSLGRGQEVYERLKLAAEARGAAVVWMKRGDGLEAGKLRMVCLYPEGSSHTVYPAGEKSGAARRPEEEDRNEHSLVLKVDYGSFHMLLTGDMSCQGEEELLEDSWAAAHLEDTQVLKVAHHGSKYSTGEQWLEKVSPRWAVISYGEGNRYGHPHEEVLKRLEDQGSAVYETGRRGAVMLHTDGETIRWSTWLKEK